MANNHAFITGRVVSIRVPGDDVGLAEQEPSEIIITLEWQKYPDGSHPVRIPVSVERIFTDEECVDVPKRVLEVLKCGMYAAAGGPLDMVGFRHGSLLPGISARALSVCRNGRWIPVQFR